MKTRKFNKKLSLNKETISNLRADELMNVKGGWRTGKCTMDPYWCDTYTECGGETNGICTDSECPTWTCYS